MPWALIEVRREWSREEETAIIDAVRPLPIIGDLAGFARDQFGFLSSLHRRFGDVAEWSLGSTRVAVLFHPDDVGLVLAAAGANGPLGRGQEGTFARHAEITGNSGLILSEGAYWRRQRRTLQPGMRPGWIESYAKVISSFSEEAVQGWDFDQTRDVQRDMEELVGRIAMKTLLGTDLGDEMAEKLKRASDRMLMFNMLEYALGSKLPVWVPTPLRHWLKNASKRTDRLIMAAVEQRLAERKMQAAGSGQDMLDMLLDARDDDGQTRPRSTREIKPTTSLYSPSRSIICRRGRLPLRSPKQPESARNSSSSTCAAAHRLRSLCACRCSPRSSALHRATRPHTTGSSANFAPTARPRYWRWPHMPERTSPHTSTEIESIKWPSCPV
jgi:hypothetical protein